MEERVCCVFPFFLSLLSSESEGRVAAWRTLSGQLTRSTRQAVANTGCPYCWWQNPPDFPQALGTTPSSWVLSFLLQLSSHMLTFSLPDHCLSFHIQMWLLTGHTTKVEAGDFFLFNHVEVYVIHYIIFFYVKHKSVA